MLTLAGVWVACSVALAVFWAFVHRELREDVGEGSEWLE